MKFIKRAGNLRLIRNFLGGLQTHLTNPPAPGVEWEPHKALAWSQCFQPSQAVVLQEHRGGVFPSYSVAPA